MKETITALDIESSGFNGYPIQIGIIKENGAKYQSLINPHEEWLTDLEWDYNAQCIHSFELAYIKENGRDINTVAREINEFVDGDDVFIDSHYDVMWLNLLFEFSDVRRNFKMQVIYEICSDEFCEHWSGVFHMELKKSGLKLHDALNDAILIQRTYKKIASHF